MQRNTQITNCIGVGLTINSHRLDAKLLGRSHDTNGNLSAIGDEELVDLMTSDSRDESK